MSFGDGTQPYGKGIAEATGYFPFGEAFVLASRLRLGGLFGADAQDIAPSRRFFAGGGGSVRGFGYQQLGPKDPFADPIGGGSLTEFSLEGRYRFGNLGVVGFLDGRAGLPELRPEVQRHPLRRRDRRALLHQLRTSALRRRHAHPAARGRVADQRLHLHRPGVLMPSGAPPEQDAPAARGSAPPPSARRAGGAMDRRDPRRAGRARRRGGGADRHGAGPSAPDGRRQPHDTGQRHGLPHRPHRRLALRSLDGARRDAAGPDRPLPHHPPP